MIREMNYIKYTPTDDDVIINDNPAYQLHAVSSMNTTNTLYIIIYSKCTRLLTSSL